MGPVTKPSAQPGPRQPSPVDGPTRERGGDAAGRPFAGQQPGAGTAVAQDARKGISLSSGASRGREYPRQACEYTHHHPLLALISHSDASSLCTALSKLLCKTLPKGPEEDSRRPHVQRGHCTAPTLEFTP